MVILNEKVGRYEIHCKLFDEIEIESTDENNLAAMKMDDNNDSYDSSHNISGFI